MAVGISVLIIGSTTPHPMPLPFAIVAAAIMALVAGIVIAAAVRFGFFLAGCRELTIRLAWVTAVANVLVLGILGALPIQTHSVVIDMRSGQSGPVEAPHTLGLTLLVALLVPAFIAYIVGRLARRPAE